jgi:phosphoribosylformylglycinamidine synthase
MSGTYGDITVPPTLISFALGMAKASKLISNVLYDGAKVYRISLPRSASGCPDYEFFADLMRKLSAEINKGKIKFCSVVEAGGTAAAVARSCLGNGVGFKFAEKSANLFYPRLGDILVEGDISGLKEFSPEYIGTAGGDKFVFEGEELHISRAEKDYLKTLSGVFPLAKSAEKAVSKADSEKFTYKKYKGVGIAKPKVLIPVFPGSSGEYDLTKKFYAAGAETEILIVRNRNPQDIKESLAALSESIKKAQIIAIAGSINDGSDKFIEAAFREAEVSAALEKFREKQGLILGIGSGFQAFIRLGLFGYDGLSFDHNNRHTSVLRPVRVSSVNSPWLSRVKVGDVFITPVSVVEGGVKIKGKSGICGQFLNEAGKIVGIEGIVSPCGMIFGKIGHSERADNTLFKNIPGEKFMDIFRAAADYFRK